MIAPDKELLNVLKGSFWYLLLDLHSHLVNVYLAVCDIILHFKRVFESIIALTNIIIFKVKKQLSF